MASRDYANDREIASLAISILSRAYVLLNEYLVLSRLPTEEEPDLLVHYTSDLVTNLILSSQDVFLFDATSSNDKDEQVQGIETLWRGLHNAWELSLQEAAAIENVIENCGSLQPHNIQRIADLMRRSLITPHSTFGMVLCTSDAHDNLAMWREYGDDGAGAALTLNASHLHSVVSGSSSGVFRVIYDNALKGPMARFLAVSVLEATRERNAISWTKQVSEIGRRLRIREILSAAISAAGLLSFLFKHPCYAYEREYRLIHLAVGNQHLRELTKNGHVRRYVPYSALCRYPDSLHVAEVMLGPRALESTRQREIVAKCRERGIPVTFSDLPYRGSDVPVSRLRNCLSGLQESEELRRAAREELQRRFPESSRLQHSRVSQHWQVLQAEAIRKNQG